ncbi:hypothetical protein N0B31_00325 [Salinirubellus salinus]|uniref:Uncharacterized protein n=1 Tax=Salinirubellus salinus TaxID=1364945 RepID=A0A9E7R2U0_9EURY|nr:hypothetical protein [Salinirubellus salinus]UWM54672.1 hypothetical protein N0B31_21460 [Salinirubellus salinus]UWM54741.1 hypothetical protein N0B31_00325 [Salinirubellus salinus]
MKPTRIVVAALAVLALTLGVGAAAAAPDDAPSENAPAEAGPPSDLPGPVPEFVGDIHETVRGFLDGTVENLGQAVSDLTPGDGETPASENAGGD